MRASCTKALDHRLPRGTTTTIGQVGFDMELRAVSEELRHGGDEKVMKEKLLDRLKRDFRRKEC